MALIPSKQQTLIPSKQLSRIPAKQLAATSLAYDFTTGTPPSGITASGAANGTAMQSSGLLAAAAAPRFQYNPAAPTTCLGLLVEAAVANVIGYSEAIGGTGWSGYNGGSVTLNAAASPRGDQTASQIGPTQGLGGYYGGTGPQIAAGTTRTTSAFFKWVSGPTPLQIAVAGSQLFNNSGGDRVVNFDGQTGAFISKSSDVTSYTIEKYPNGWWRVSGTYTTLSASNNAPIAVYAGQSGTTYLAWGAQSELGAGSTSYIAVAASAAVTRTADAISFSVPSGTGHLTYTYGDGSTQTVAVTPGAYTMPATAGKAVVAKIVGAA